MADYFMPTVVQPIIPESDMTPLERLILTSAFQSEPDGDGLYFFAEMAIEEMLACDVDDLAAALVQSPEPTGLSSAVQALLAAPREGGLIDLDLTAGVGWESVFQDIIRRSATLDHVIVTSAFTCTKMRPDGFGGMVVLITADHVFAKSTEEVLCELMDEAEYGPIGVEPGLGSHVLLRLSEEHVRATVEVIFETEAPAGLSPTDVTNEDIRHASLDVKAASDLSQEEGEAAFKAALRAIRIAAERPRAAR